MAYFRIHFILSGLFQAKYTFTFTFTFCAMGVKGSEPAYEIDEKSSDFDENENCNICKK